MTHPETGVHDERSAFHKDFKIGCFNSEKGRKDKLLYISLLKHNSVKEWWDKSYPGKEIVNAVLRAITPGLYLRNVLETTESLTFSRLMKFFRSRFVERITTDLCQHLSSITQGSQETATQFVCYAMSLRQKLIVLSKSPAVEIKFDQDLVQMLFLKSLETGLTTVTVMRKPLLRNLSVSDEDLIFAVSQASSYDQQRSVKINKSKIKPRMNVVGMKYEAENELTWIPRNQDSAKENNLWKCLLY